MANVTQHPPQPSPTDEPANGGQLALQRAIDDAWAQTRNPKITLFGMTALYRRIAELRAAIAQLEHLPDEPTHPTW